MDDGRRPLLLYDGECGLCATVVRFALDHEQSSRTLAFAPLHGATWRALTQHRVELQQVDTVLWVDDRFGAQQKVLMRSDAAIALGRYLGGPWSVVATMAALVPRRVRDACYDFVARHRRQVASGRCVVPTPGQRSRFLD